MGIVPFTTLELVYNTIKHDAINHQQYHSEHNSLQSPLNDTDKDSTNRGNPQASTVLIFVANDVDALCTCRMLVVCIPWLFIFSAIEMQTSEATERSDRAKRVGWCVSLGSIWLGLIWLDPDGSEFATITHVPYDYWVGLAWELPSEASGVMRMAWFDMARFKMARLDLARSGWIRSQWLNPIKSGWSVAWPVQLWLERGLIGSILAGVWLDWSWFGLGWLDPCLVLVVWILVWWLMTWSLFGPCRVESWFGDGWFGHCCESRIGSRTYTFMYSSNRVSLSRFNFTLFHFNLIVSFELVGSGLVRFHCERLVWSRLNWLIFWS